MSQVEQPRQLTSEGANAHTNDILRNSIEETFSQLVHAAVTSPRVPLRRTWCPEAGVHAQYKPDFTATTILGDFSIIVRASTFFEGVKRHSGTRAR